MAGFCFLKAMAYHRMGLAEQAKPLLFLALSWDIHFNQAFDILLEYAYINNLEGIA